MRFFKVIVLLFFVSLLAQAKELKLKHETVDLVSHEASQLKEGFSPTVVQYYVVQFKDVIQPQDESVLKKLRIEILRYLPEDAYIVKANHLKIEKLKNSNARVHAVGHYVSDWKLASDLQTLSVFDSDEIVYLSVSVLPKASISNIIKELENATVVTKSKSHLILQTMKSQASVIANIEGIEWIQLLPRFETFDFQMSNSNEAPMLGETKTGYESGTKVMNFDAAWDRGFSGSGQIVAMADTGLDLGSMTNMHADLKTVIGGEAVGLFGKSWEDPQGHGTHVAGSVVGQGTLSEGLIKGGAYSAGFFAQGMWSPILNNISVPQDLKTIFASARNKGARIHTNSWGTVANLGGYDNFSAAVDEYMFKNQDFLIVFAAGNSGEDKNKDGVIDPKSVSSPGTAKNTLTVGASENYMVEGGRQNACGEMTNGSEKWGVEPIKSDKLSNNINGIACFSSRGPTNDNRIKPEIVAPGTNIVSLRSFHPKATRLWGAYNDNYSWAGGTSMATPLTAGAAAVAREYLVKNGFENPSSALVKATLLHTSTSLRPGQFGEGAKQEIPNARPNNVEGYGLVNMDFVTSFFDANSGSVVKDSKEGLATSESEVVTLIVTTEMVAKDAMLRATLVYADAPAAASASKTLVNDLDLEVITPSGEKLARNDTVNNSEMIEITDLSVGNYEFTIRARSVPMGLSGKQPYAFILSHVKNTTSLND